MHPNAQLIDTFYKAFAAKDAATMAACYHPDAKFSDPVFPDLEGWQAAAMWKMFCERPGSDLTIEHSGVEGTDTTAKAHWDARYTFATGRKVLNRIDAAFEMKDGKIWRHRDSFPFWKWTRMALGMPGLLLGWSPIVKNKVRSQGRKALDGYIKLEGLGPVR